MTAIPALPVTMYDENETIVVSTPAGYWQAIWEGFRVSGPVPPPARSEVPAHLSDLDTVEAKIPSAASLSATIAGRVRLPEKSLSGVGFYTYGHSFVVGATLADVSQRYASLLTGGLGMTYVAERAIAGSHVSSAAVQAINTAPWVAGTRGVVLVQALLNTARLKGSDPLMLSGARHSLRTICALAAASSRVESTDARFTYSGTWATSGVTTSASASTWQSTTSVGGYFEYVATGGEYLILVGRSDTNGSLITITDQTAASTLGTFNTSSQSDSSLGTTIPYAYKVPVSAAGHTIRFARTSGSNTLAFDVMLPQAVNPIPVVLMKEPYLLDYSASVAFPNGSDAVLDAFNALLDEMAVEFPNVIVANPNTAGYWDKTKHIGPDAVHPNVDGHQALYLTARDALERGLVARAAKATI